MGLGNMSTFIDIVEPRKVKGESGFITVQDVILASVRAYKEMRHGTRVWANRAAFSKATVLFRFRKIDDLKIDTSHVIVCDTGRYRIFSIEDVKNRGMYMEALCDKDKISGAI